jgi:hypothetical protein
VSTLDNLRRLFQELSAAPSREDASQVFEATDAKQFSESEFEVACIYCANILYEWDR